MIRATRGKAIGRAMGLRLRLTLSYIILVTLLLIGLGVLFRKTLEISQEQAASELLQEEWAAVKGYITVDGGRAVWHYDRDDPEETSIVLRYRQGLFFLADKNGRILEVSDAYSYLGVEKVDEIREILKQPRSVVRMRRDQDKVAYMIRSGLHVDDGRKEFLLSIGHSMANEERVVAGFTRMYFGLVPVLILALSAAGWLMAGRAIRPLNDVALAAQSITGTNLSLRITRRGAGDELDHLIDTFNGMVDRLENSFNQVRQFSTDVSHELRTPLTAIRGQLEVALFTAQSIDQYREAIMSAMEDVDRLGQVVRQLLHLSQAETGQVALAREPVDLKSLAEDVVEQFQIPAESQGLELRADLAPATVEGDRIQIERMLSNLLSNAIKYTPAGGRVRVVIRPVEEGVEIRVTDTGRGIPPAHLPNIFDRFYRVPDGTHDPERGLGLGLSFVAWIAKAHNATIQVESSPGVGSTFTVTFPAPVLQPALAS